MNDLDLILMGGIFASSTSDLLNAFILGIQSGIGENGKPLYLSMARVSSGVSNNDLSTLNKKIKQQGVKFENFNSRNLVFGKEVPHYYLEPEFSLIFTVRATELTRSTGSSFKTPYTLRFPRILKIRDDKPVDECLSMNELLELSQSNKSVIKLKKRHVTLEEILKSKKRKIKRPDIIMPEIYEKEQVLDFLESYTILVLSGINHFTKEKAESYIKRAGGKIAYRISEPIDIVLVGEHSQKVKDLVRKRETFDIVNVSWLQRVIDDGNLLGYEQEEVYYLGNSYKNCLSDELDCFGDSYTVETTTDKLRRTFQIIQEIGISSNQNNTVQFKGFSKNFSNYTAFFDKHQNPDDTNSKIIYDSFLDEIEFRYYCGNITRTISESVNLIIYNGQIERRDELEMYLAVKNISNLEIKPNQFIYE